jgi:hypothetical protein
MVKCFALVTEVALSSMGLDWVGCSKGVRFSMVWIWLVFQGRVIFKGLDQDGVSGFSLFNDVGFWWVFSGLGLIKRFGSGCFRLLVF